MEWWWFCCLFVGFIFVCGCPCQCSNCFDNFDRSDNTDINTGSSCGWTEVAGTWDISSNKLQTTSSNAIAISTAAPSSGAMFVRAQGAKSNTSGDKIIAIIDYVDSSNFHFAEVNVHATSGYLKIRRMTGGVPADLATTNVNLTVNSAFNLEVCLDQTLSYITATVGQSSSGANDAVSVGVTPHGGTGAGLGTRTVAGTITFGENHGITLNAGFHLFETRAGCGVCAGVQCDQCDYDNAGIVRITPQLFKVVITGVTNGTCLLCASTNATFYVDRGSTAFASDCVYTAVGGACFGTLRLTLKTNNVIKVAEEYLGSDSLVWEDAATSGFVDCDELVDRVVPYSSSTGRCVGTASTCKVSSQ